MDVRLRKDKKNTLVLLAYASILAFLICYLVIGYYNRHSADDLDGLEAIKEKGVIGAWIFQYFNWAGPFSAAFIYYVLTFVFKTAVSLFWYNALTILVLIWSYWLMVSRLSEKLLNIESKRFTFLSISLISALFFASPRLCEVWFWFCGSIEYVWSFVFLFLAIYFLAGRNDKRSNLGLACFFFFLFGGGPINYPLTAGMIFFGYMAYVYFRHKKTENQLIIAFVFLVLGTTVHVIAPGNYIRRGHVEGIISHDFVTIASQMGKGWFRIIFYNALFQFPYIIILLSPVLLAGSFFSERLPEAYKKINFLKLFLLLAFIYSAAVLLHCFLLYFALGDAGGPTRTRLFLHLIYCGSIAILLFLAGARYKNMLMEFSFIPALMLTGGILLYVLKATRELPVASAYSAAYDARMDKIFEAKKNYENNKIETLYLEPLPPSQNITYNDPYFSDFRKAGVMNYFLSIPNGSLQSTDIYKRRGKDQDSIVDVFREDHINIKLEKLFDLPFRIDLIPETNKNP